MNCQHSRRFGQFAWNAKALHDASRKIVSSINSHQDLVIIADQPVYALGKQVQWMYPDRFKNFVWMMRPLHIEMTLLNAVGDWLKGSSWLGVFKKSKISTSGSLS